MLTECNLCVCWTLLVGLSLPCVGVSGVALLTDSPCLSSCRSWLTVTCGPTDKTGSCIHACVYRTFTDNTPIQTKCLLLFQCYFWEWWLSSCASSKKGCHAPFPLPRLCTWKPVCTVYGSGQGSGQGTLAEQHRQVRTLLFPIIKLFKLNLDVCSIDSLAMFVSFDGVDT